MKTLVTGFSAHGQLSTHGSTREDKFEFEALRDSIGQEDVLDAELLFYGWSQTLCESLMGHLHNTY